MLPLCIYLSPPVKFWRAPPPCSWHLLETLGGKRRGKFQWGESEILLGEFFYQVKGTWVGAILMIQTFFKAKTAFCEYWTSKSKLTWPMSPKSMKLNQKWSKNNDYSWKCCFYWVITWKLLLSGGSGFWGGIDFCWEGGGKSRVQ